MLSACSNEDVFAPETPQPGNGTIELTVSTSDFVTDGAPHTRATDNGNATTFEKGDRIGLIIVADNGKTLVADNLPYKYDGESWAFDTGNKENKAIPYYVKNVKDVTYIAYFPYSSGANKVKTLDALKGKFIPKNDQRSETNYRASDLMVWTSGDASIPQKKLDITLTHAYASISLSPERVEYTLDDGNDTFLSYAPRVSDVCFTVGDGVYYPFQAEDGSFRCILPTGTSAVRWFYTLDGKTYGSSCEFNSGATANTRYVRQETMDGGRYGLDRAQAGDFYCKNSSGNGYLVPDDFAPLSDEQKNTCLGIVYWVGDIKGDNYGLLDSKLPNSMHGLVVSLWDMPASNGDMTMTWMSGNYMNVNNWLRSAIWSDGNPSRPQDFTSIQVTDKMQGYANTIALKKFHENKSPSGIKINPVEGLAPFETAHPAPLNSSGWYWPSVCELKYVCWGQGNGSGTKGRTMLDIQIEKVSGDVFVANGNYWSSTEDENDGDDAVAVKFNKGSVYSTDKKFLGSYNVRLVLAF